MELQQFTLRFGPYGYELNIPIPVDADKTKLAEALIMAGVSLMDKTALVTEQKEQEEAARQKFFAWAEDEGFLAPTK